MSVYYHSPPSLLCCFASLLHIITYSNDPTLRTFSVDQNPSPPFLLASHGHFTVLLTSSRHRQPPLRAIWIYGSLYAYDFPLASPFPPTICTSMRSRFPYSAPCSLSEVVLSFTIAILSLLSFFAVAVIGYRRGIIVDILSFSVS